MPHASTSRGDCAVCGEPAALPCDCRTLSYCSHEHKEFDWKRHKPTCKTVLAKRDSSSSASTASGGTLPSVPSAPSQVVPAHEDTPLFPLPAGLPAPQPRRAPVFALGRAGGSLDDADFSKSASTSPPASAFSSVASMSGSSGTGLTGSTATASASLFFLQQNNLSNGSLKHMESSSSMGSSGSRERIMHTDDDSDIQIIAVKPAQNRKRQTPMGDIELKDHSLNTVYRTTLQEHQRKLSETGRVLNAHQALTLRLQYIADHVLAGLNTYGWSVVDNFLGQAQCKHTRKEVERLTDRGLFSAGQLMENKLKDENHVKDIRSDQIYWYDGADERARDAATIRLLVSMIDSVTLHFSKKIDPYNIGGRSRAMIALYPGNGTRYVKHVDNPVGDGRCITAIYYCNPGWDADRDGGILRLYPETSASPMDICPDADRLVFFWSDRRNPHEVMPVYKERYAITLWYMDKDERSRAVSKGTAVPAAEEKEKEKVERVIATPIRKTASPPRESPFEMAESSRRSVLSSGYRDRNGDDESETSDDPSDDLPKAPETNPEYEI